jgi:hypothetical protein
MTGMLNVILNSIQDLSELEIADYVANKSGYRVASPDYLNQNSPKAPLCLKHHFSQPLPKSPILPGP